MGLTIKWNRPIAVSYFYGNIALKAIKADIMVDNMLSSMFRRNNDSKYIFVDVNATR